MRAVANLAALGLLVSVSGAALAQDVEQPPPPATEPGLQAPKGHRQPRPADIAGDRQSEPQAQGQTQVPDRAGELQKRMDERSRKAIRSICRDC